MTTTALLPVGMSVPLMALSPDAFPEPSGTLTPLAPVRASRKSRKALREAGETPEQAYDDLCHALLLAKERGQVVPCLGEGADDWVSDDPGEQQTAADACLDCPMSVFALCKRYADIAKPEGGTWAGATSDPARKRDPRAGRCSCDCGGWTRGGRYLPGHDTRHVERLVRLVNGGAMPRLTALAKLGTPGLRGKLSKRLGS
ncbi:hypothetical protein MRBLWH7_000349 [Microbacterium sp. LWH7-1.2]|uniref:hypothetical protein n=1 Tax=Microbacterium sp. LWH7-1.2 TaxID=3135257 RepID=UPI0031388BED